MDGWYDLDELDVQAEIEQYDNDESIDECFYDDEAWIEFYMESRR